MGNRYITEEDVYKDGLKVEWDMRQAWHHKFNVNSGGLKDEAYYINKQDGYDVKLFKLSRLLLNFLYNNKVATKSQLIALAISVGFKKDAVKNLLNDFLKHRILNAFCLTNYDLEYFPSDACMFYTLDFAGVSILRHYSPSQQINWRRSDVEYGPELVVNMLQVNQFLISLYAALPRDDVRYFESHSKFSFWRDEILISADFAINDEEGKGKVFLLQAFNSSEVPLTVRAQAEKIARFYEHKEMEKYFDDKPVLIVLTERDEDVITVAKIYEVLCPNIIKRYVTNSSIKDGFTPKTFFKYDEENQTLKITQAKLFKNRKESVE